MRVREILEKMYYYYEGEGGDRVNTRENVL